MLTTGKAICEMNSEELASEYLYCINAADEDIFDPETQRYFRDRAEVVKKYIQTQHAQEGYYETYYIASYLL